MMFNSFTTEVCTMDSIQIRYLEEMGFRGDQARTLSDKFTPLDVDDGCCLEV